MATWRYCHDRHHQQLWRMDFVKKIIRMMVFLVRLFTIGGHSFISFAVMWRRWMGSLFFTLPTGVESLDLALGRRACDGAGSCCVAVRGMMGH